MDCAVSLRLRAAEAKHFSSRSSPVAASTTHVGAAPAGSADCADPSQSLKAQLSTGSAAMPLGRVSADARGA